MGCGHKEEHLGGEAYDIIRVKTLYVEWTANANNPNRHAITITKEAESNEDSDVEAFKNWINSGEEVDFVKFKPKYFVEIERADKHQYYTIGEKSFKITDSSKRTKSFVIPNSQQNFSKLLSTSKKLYGIIKDE